MIFEALQFEPAGEPRKVSVLFPGQILCLRQTRSSLEFLWERPGRDEEVVAVEGRNLGIIRREIVCDARTTVACGPCGPAWARCSVSRIHPRLTLTKPAAPMAPDPNTVAEWFIQMETGTARDLWPHGRLDAFAVPRGREEKFLMQFHGRHAYVLTAIPGTFSTVLAAIRRENFTYSMTNCFTVFQGIPLPGVVLRRHAFQSIEYRPETLAQRREWEVLRDFRVPRPPGPSQSISID